MLLVLLTHSVLICQIKQQHSTALSWSCSSKQVNGANLTQPITLDQNHRPCSAYQTSAWTGFVPCETRSIRTSGVECDATAPPVCCLTPTACLLAALFIHHNSQPPTPLLCLIAPPIQPDCWTLSYCRFKPVALIVMCRDVEELQSSLLDLFTLQSCMLYAPTGSWFVLVWMQCETATSSGEMTLCIVLARLGFGSKWHHRC